MMNTLLSKSEIFVGPSSHVCKNPVSWSLMRYYTADSNNSLLNLILFE
jgi:hypothetical protein